VAETVAIKCMGPNAALQVGSPGTGFILARQRTTTPTKPDDARAQRSIEALSEAFLQLLEHKPLEDITIKEITAQAGLSYPTFFRRYSGKEDLLADIATEEVRRLLSLSAQALNERDSQKSVESLCAYVQVNRGLWKTLLTGGAAPAMREEFMRLSMERPRPRKRANPWLPFDLAVPFVASGMFEIFAWWMAQPEDYPVENVITIIDELIIDLARRPRNITLK